MKVIRVLVGLFVLALLLVPAYVRAGTIAPDCAYAELKLFTHYYQSGLMGSDCSDSAEYGYDVNFGDSYDAFRTVDNNDADSWEYWAAYSWKQHCLIFLDSASGSGSSYSVKLLAGGTDYWGNFPSTWINRISRYTMIAQSPGAAC